MAGEFSRRVIFRADPRDFVTWVATAKRRGKKFSVWARETLNAEAARQPAERVPTPPVRAEVVPPAAPLRTQGVTRLGTGRVAGVSSAGEVEHARSAAKELAQRSGKCSADVERGVRCRFCGKIHT